MIARPKHLDFPDEVTIGEKLYHFYSAHENGKRALESLIWLCGRYHHVEVVTNDGEVKFRCRTAFSNSDFDLNTED